MKQAIFKFIHHLAAAATVLTVSTLFTTVSPALKDTFTGAKAGEEIIFRKEVIAKVDPDGKTIRMVNMNDSWKNGAALSYILNNNVKKTVVLPKGKYEVDRTIHVGNDTSIEATGTNYKVVFTGKNIFNNECKGPEYGCLKNFSINGGTWDIAGISSQKNSWSSFRFAHATNIKLTNMEIKSNYINHAIELIACKNVVIDGVDIDCLGSPKKNCSEENIQIDLATPRTAPSVEKFGKKYVQGQTCHNITIKNCNVKGSRGICASSTPTENKKWYGKYHTNIKISNCTITGATSEALVLQNCKGVSVKYNKIISNSKRLNEVYSIGLNIPFFKADKSTSKYSYEVIGNLVKGGRQGIYIISYGGNKFGTTTVRDNKVYCKKGKDNAITVIEKDVTKLIESDNQSFAW